MSNPFHLCIFVSDSDPDGMRIVDNRNWIDRAQIFPHAQPLWQATLTKALSQGDHL